MKNNDNNLSEEAKRMSLLAGIPRKEVNEEALNEGLLSNIAGILGITALSLGNLLGQTEQDFEKLREKGYDEKALKKIENAMENPTVQNKLKELGVPDNNIQKALKSVGRRDKFTSVIEKPTSDLKEVKTLLRLGYSLTSIEADKLIDITKSLMPQSTILNVLLTLGDDAIFQSGKFELNEKGIADIRNILDTIAINQEQLVKITIESSTDKQGISPTLQSQLKVNGYSPNNEGLSSIRNNSVKNVLISNNVDSSLIEQSVKFEQGSQISDQKFRYVKVEFQVLKISMAEIPTEPVYKNANQKEIYHLLKSYIKTKHKRKLFNLENCDFKLNLFNRKKSNNPVGCPKF